MVPPSSLIVHMQGEPFPRIDEIFFEFIPLQLYALNAKACMSPRVRRLRGGGNLLMHAPQGAICWSQPRPAKTGFFCFSQSPVFLLISLGGISHSLAQLKSSSLPSQSFQPLHFYPDNICFNPSKLHILTLGSFKTPILEKISHVDV